MPPVRISSYHKIVDGKVVNVNSYSVHRNAGAHALATPGRPMLTAVPGQFPGGRSTPNIYPVTKRHGDAGGTAKTDAQRAATDIARIGGPAGLGAGKLPTRGPAINADGSVKRLVASAREKAALSAYLGKDYSEIQAMLRGAQGNSSVTGRSRRKPAALLSQVRYLDDLLGRAVTKTGNTVFHVLQALGLPGAISPGSVIKDLGFVSALPSRERAQGIAQKRHAAVVSLHIPPGSHAVRIGDHVPSAGDEMLLPHGSQFKVTSDEMVNGVRVIDAELVGGPKNVMTAAEASKTTERAFASLKSKQRSAQPPQK